MEDQQQRQGPGKVARGVNMGIDAAYTVLWGVLTLIGVVGIFIPQTRWVGLLATAVFGYFTYRNVRNLVVVRGRE